MGPFIINDEEFSTCCTANHTSMRVKSIGGCFMQNKMQNDLVAAFYATFDLNFIQL